MYIRELHSPHVELFFGFYYPISFWFLISLSYTLVLYSYTVLYAIVNDYINTYYIDNIYILQRSRRKRKLCLFIEFISGILIYIFLDFCSAFL